MKTRPASTLQRLPYLAFLLMALTACKGGGSGSNNPSAAVTPLDPPVESEPPGDQPAFPLLDHLEQEEITEGAFSFSQLFRIGDDLFEAAFTTLDGVGALALPDGTALVTRFSRLPPGGGRFTGPNGQACAACHNSPFGTSAGEIAANVLQDPSRTGQPPFNSRNTISLFGSGLVQRLAEEMTEMLLTLRDAAVTEALQTGTEVRRDLVAKGISFGSLRVSVDGAGFPIVDASAVEGISPDLVVRPFGWKGDTPSLRGFCRDAARNELGMEAEELVMKDPAGGLDPDGDGVERELSIGDVTALTVYVAAQETPTTVAAMAAAGRLPPSGGDFSRARDRGEQVFETLGCTACHRSELQLVDPVFEEPTSRGGGRYADPDLLPPATALAPESPVRVHLGREGDFPRPQPHSAGGLRVRLFGDLKRHSMGSHLADPQPTPVVGADGRVLLVDGVDVAVPSGVFLTPELWGVGNTGPWLHDGRAATLEEAILLHGIDTPPPPGAPERSEAQEARDAFAELSDGDREAVVTFLKSLILFAEEE